ncbi:MAG: membrane protein insertion efficiency factor YidD [Anaerolineales bacterium]|nr:membrane protein insertion efficiency factor YidD [Anaerolineales bacterium]
MKWLFTGMIRLYQVTLSKITPHSCIFQPTCSQYGIEAIKKHGIIKGCWLTFKRICRCNPWNEGRYDPVP